MRELDETSAGGPIGARLAACRRRRGLTRDELSSSTGLEFGYLAGLETGGEWMDRRGRLAALATALRLDVADLTGQPYPPRGEEHAAVRAVAFHLRRRLVRRQADTAPGVLLEDLAVGAAMQIVVAGQGYVGLPLAVRAAEVGHRAVGYDVDPHRVQQLAAGQSYVEDVASSRLRAVLDSGVYSATADAAALAGFDIAVITVPTPLRDGVPDLTYIESCAWTLGEHLRPGATVVLESTTYPGTTEELLLPIPETASGLKGGVDFLEVEDFLSDLEDQGVVEVFDEGEEDGDVYVFFVTGAGEGDLLAVASRVATLSGVPAGTVAVVSNDEAEEFGLGRRVTLPLPAL